jgi:hypothetical protein
MIRMRFERRVYTRVQCINIYIPFPYIKFTGNLFCDNKQTDEWVIINNWLMPFSSLLVGIEVLTAVVTMPCSPLKINQRFGEIYHHCLQRQRIIRVVLIPWKIKIIVNRWEIKINSLHLQWLCLHAERKDSIYIRTYIHITIIQFNSIQFTFIYVQT